ncbi:MFS transporter, MCP family, solute carrier family 16, member 6 [Bisporella sp. PMI_857]|nr:MFS transporter, MCP family, solute carrier family 16, member 6 [Bisporella sp. PMI_857]
MSATDELQEVAKENQALPSSTFILESPTIEPPPDGGAKAWSQVGASFTINAFTWGQTASFGVYLAHFLRAGMFPEARPLDYAFIGGLQFSISLAIGPLVTPLVRKFGTQIPMLVGIFIQCIGFITASFSMRIWHLYLTQGVLLGIGQGFIFVPCSPVISQWFSKKRSLAQAISSAGVGIGGIIFSFGIQAMIDNVSFCWSLRITAAMCTVMNTTAVAVLRNRNSTIRPPQLAFDTKLLRRYDVLLVLSWAFITMLGYITLIYSVSDFTKSLGLSSSQAAAISAFLNVGAAVGRPLIGLISDRYGRIETSGIFTFLSGLICFAIWIPAKTYGVTILFAILTGAMSGVFWMTLAPIAVEVVGLAHVPSLLSITWLTIVLPTLFSEVIALYLRRPGAENKYLHVQVFAGLAGIVSSLCLLELWRIVRRKK